MRNVELTMNIYKRIPVLVREGSSELNPWNITFRQGIFNMTSGSHLFRTREQLEAEGWMLKGNTFFKDDEVCLPLYEGKMISYFDHRFGTYEGQTQAQANQGKLPELNEVQHTNPFLFPLSQYWVHQSHLPNLMRDGRKVFLVFRDVARSVDSRTAVFCTIPLVPCSNKLPIIILDPKCTRCVIYLASCTSSFVFDYVARQKIGGANMGFFILKQLPVLPPNCYKEICNWDYKISLGDWIWTRSLELTYTAWDLEPFAKNCGYDGPPFRWNDDRRFLLRCELDAAYFHLYGIKRDDVDYIMETFPIVKRKDEKLYREYRTKRVILEIYDEMLRAMKTGEPYKTRLEPLAADPLVAHPPKENAEVYKQ